MKEIKEEDLQLQILVKWRAAFLNLKKTKKRLMSFSGFRL